MDTFKLKNRKFPKEFNKVAKFMFNSKHIKVSLGETTEFLGHFNRQIIIHHNYDLRNNGLFALLHECGHALQPPTNIGVNSYKNLDETEYPYEYRLGRFMGEIDAWDKGYQLAISLDIFVDKKRYNKEKNRILLTYFN